ncbi:MAG: ribosomal protein S18-alanine N-acetyltransferase [Candidatus Zixiibacteriota bacterium]
MTTSADQRIRVMRERDATAVAALESRIFSDAWSAELFRESLAAPDGGGIIIESGEGAQTRLIGYACYYSAAGETHLTNIAVSPESRRQGFAEQLLRRVFNRARESGSEAIFLEVRPSNTAARQLYERRGFHVLYRRKRYYHDPCEDAIVYVCELEESVKRAVRPAPVSA